MHVSPMEYTSNMQTYSNYNNSISITQKFPATLTLWKPHYHKLSSQKYYVAICNMFETYRLLKRSQAPELSLKLTGIPSPIG